MSTSRHVNPVYEILLGFFYLLIIISILIFHEIIILHICGMEENTKTFIEERGIHEHMREISLIEEEINNISNNGTDQLDVQIGVNSLYEQNLDE